ncbi:MAG: hypothetical protein HFG05_12615 [Oscillibacter sp.]|nr:hypothetical protein [Oscillibacter sp.]
MDHLLMFSGIALIVVILIGLVIRWRKVSAKMRQDREQIDRKIKEDALDRALSNGPLPKASVRPQAPVEIHYDSKPKKESGSMLRLTEQAESVCKEYLFQCTATIYIGEEYGRAAVFEGRGAGTLYCELFPHEDGMYVRLCGKAECRLLRGRQIAALTPNAIQLRSKDKIETQTGVFLVEFI